MKRTLNIIIALWVFLIASKGQKDAFRQRYRKISREEWESQSRYLAANPHVAHTIDPHNDRVHFENDDDRVHYLLSTGGQK